MKLSVTYLVTILKYGYPPKPADDIRSLEYLNRLGFTIWRWKVWARITPKICSKI